MISGSIQVDSSLQVDIKQLSIKEDSMTSVLKIGNLRLDMGNMSHVLGIQNTEKGVSTYLKYATYQSKFR